MADLTIGIDLGGSKILALVTDQAGQVLARAKQRTDVEAGLDGIAAQMRDAAVKALEKCERSWEDVREIGAAVPGAVTPGEGVVLHAPALGWRNAPAGKLLSDLFERPVVLENDVNCGTFAEFSLGAAKGSESVVGYFVGTGLGGAVIIDGKVRRGRTGVAGELGHEIVRYNGRRCGCGHKGCIEAYSSKTAFCKRFRKLILEKKKKSLLPGMVRDKSFKTIRSKELAKAYRRNDKITRKVLEQGARMLGVATANLCAIVAPECVVYGGGVMEALGEELMPFIREAFEEHLFGIRPEDVSLVLSALGDDAVPLGAALAAQRGGAI